MSRWIEVTNKETDLKVLVNTDTITGVVAKNISFISGEYIELKETYEQIKWLIREAERDGNE